MKDLIRVSKSEAAAAARVLGRAFVDYPMFTYLYPDEQKRRGILTDFMAVPLYVCLKYGEVYGSSPGMEGAAAWLPPGMSPFTGGQTLRAVPFLTMLKSVFKGAMRMQAMSEFLDAKHRELAPFPHWYLQSIGVDPAHQGKGISRRLIQPMLERLNGEGTPCFLETQSEKNAGIYEHFGFRVLYKEKVPDTTLTSWGMLWEPGK